MLKTQAEISRISGKTKLVVSRFIAKHSIPPAGAKGKLKLYDTGLEPLAGFVFAKKPAAKAKQASRQAESLDAPEVSRAPTQFANISKPLNNLLSGKLPEGHKPSSMFYAKAMKIADENQDAAMLFKLGQIADKEDRDEILQQQMIKTEQAKEQIAQEKADRLKIENDIRRGLYMDRDTVKLIFGRVFSIHTSQLQPMGLKLSDTIASIPAGAGRRKDIQELIDNEVFGALGSINRLLAEWVEGG